MHREYFVNKKKKKTYVFYSFSVTESERKNWETASGKAEKEHPH